MASDNVTNINYMDERKSALKRTWALPSVKLALILVAIFLFFVIASGVKAGFKAYLDNQKVIEKLEQTGASQQVIDNTQLRDVWQEGFDASRSFIGWRNIQTITRLTVIVGIAALGMTMVIISGGIDLSAGSVIAFGTVVTAWVLMLDGIQSWMAALSCIVFCTCFGVVIGFLITRLKVVPFIITLGMMLIIRGAAKGIAHEEVITPGPKWLDDWILQLVGSLPKSDRWMLFPVGVWVMIILAILVSLMLRYSKLGRHIFAIGSNEETARLCGVNVERVKILVYTISGALIGLAGLMDFSYISVGDPTAAVGLELNIIAAVVIGGGSLSGGEGSILGSIVGAFIMTVIQTGCTQMDINTWVQEIITGVIIIIAVAFDMRRHRRALLTPSISPDDNGKIEKK